MNEKKRGGIRPNSGRKFKYGEETVNITVRIPKTKVKDFRAMVKAWLDQFRTKK